MDESTDELKAVTGQDSWFQFTATGDSIKIIELKREEQVPHESNAEFDEQDDSNLIPPLSEDEQYVMDTSEENVDPEPPEDPVVYSFNIQQDLYSQPTPAPTTTGRDKGILLSLMIHQVLSSEIIDKVIKFDGMVYKRARIFGTIIEKQVTENNNMITIDDGTGQLKCFIKSDLNVDDYDLNGDAAFPPGHPGHEFFRMMYEQDRAEQEELPTFEEMKIGDRVCAMGNVKFYKDGFYVFVEKLSRHKNVHDFIMFLDAIFERHKRKQELK